jgi:hypothetical protein
MIKVNNVNPKALIRIVTGADVTKGALLVLANETAVEAAAGVATQIIVGVAAESAASGAVAIVYPVIGEILEIDYDTDGTKTTFADADIGGSFDISVASHNYFIDPDDTTGPLRLIAYDNDKGVAQVMVKALYCAVA